MARRGAAKTRIDLEVRQRDAENRREFRKVQKWARETKAQLDKISGAAKRIGLAISGFLATSAAMFAKQERAERKLSGALKTRGMDVDRLSKKYKKLASDVQATTTFGDEDILGAQATLIRLAAISEEQMPEIIRLTADWASFLGKDITSAARDIGRVMADPVKNMTLLGRYGVQVNDALKDQLKTLVEAGRLEEARLVVHRELQKVVSGTSQELAQTDVGAWVQLKNLAGDVLELVGERLLERLRPLAAWFKKLLTYILENRDAVRKFTDFLIYGLQAAIAAIIIAGFLGFLIKARLLIAALGVSARASGVLMRLMWASATLGLALLIPFVIENWTAIVDSAKIAAKTLRRVWDVTIDEIKHQFSKWVQEVKDDWQNLKAFFGFGERALPIIYSRKSYKERMSTVFKEFKSQMSGAWSGDAPPPDAEDQFAGIKDPDATPTDLSGADELANQKQLQKDLEDAEIGHFEGRKERYQQLINFKIGLAKDENEKRRKLTWAITRAEQLAGNEQLKAFKGLFKAKAAIDKLTAIREVTMDLAKNPARAFSETYAAWGFPLGAIFGAIAQAATYASLINGLATIRSMRYGGRITGGTPGVDSVPFLGQDGEGVVPSESFDDIVEQTALARDTDLANENISDELHAVLEIDGDVIAEKVTEIQKRGRAYG